MRRDCSVRQFVEPPHKVGEVVAAAAQDVGVRAENGPATRGGTGMLKVDGPVSTEAPSGLPSSAGQRQGRWNPAAQHSSQRLAMR